MTNIVKNRLRLLYRKYNKCMIIGNTSGAKYFASEYNFFLACIGGPEKYPTEYYLSMGTQFTTVKES